MATRQRRTNLQHIRAPLSMEVEQQREHRWQVCCQTVGRGAKLDTLWGRGTDEPASLTSPPTFRSSLRRLAARVMIVEGPATPRSIERFRDPVTMPISR